MERGSEGILAEEFSAAQIAEWRKAVAVRREEIFRRNWKNQRKMVGLTSRSDAHAFEFVVGWYEEFGDVVGREKERNRLDDLIAQGLDVNAPENLKKK